MSVEKYKTEKALKDKIDKYFKMCDSKTKLNPTTKEIVGFKPYTITGLCLYLDISKQAFYDHYCKKYLDSTTRARLTVENWTVEGILNGQVPTKAGDFVLKNNFKWQDKSIVENHNTDHSELSDEDLDKRIKDLE